MYIGHFGIALATKRVAPGTSLGTLIAASQFIDLIWPILLLSGVETVVIDPGNTVVTPLDFQRYPYSHSLATVMAWATLFSGTYWAVTRYRRGALTVWGAVVSHWVLDFISHRPDLPLWPGGTTFVGLGLWRSLAGTLLVEVALFAAGILFYLRATKAVDRTGKAALWALIIFLSVTFLANLFGPPPPPGAERVVAITAVLLWLLVPWGSLIDRHRRLRKQKVTTLP